MAASSLSRHSSILKLVEHNELVVAHILRMMVRYCAVVLFFWALSGTIAESAHSADE